MIYVILFISEALLPNFSNFTNYSCTSLILKVELFFTPFIFEELLIIEFNFLWLLLLISTDLHITVGLFYVILIFEDFLSMIWDSSALLDICPNLSCLTVKIFGFDNFWFGDSVLKIYWTVFFWVLIIYLSRQVHK